MAILLWVLQMIVALVVWKVVHLLFWNLRRGFGIASLLFSMFVTFVIGLLIVLLAHVGYGSWFFVIGVSVILGVANGEYEYNRGLTR